MILGKLARPKQIHAAIDGSDPGMMLVRLIEWMLQRPPAAAGAPVGPSLQLATRTTRRSFFPRQLRSFWRSQRFNMRELVQISLGLVHHYPLVNQHNYRKSPFLMEKLTINGPFSIAMLNYQRVLSGKSGNQTWYGFVVC